MITKVNASVISRLNIAVASGKRSILADTGRAQTSGDSKHSDHLNDLHFCSGSVRVERIVTEVLEVQFGGVAKRNDALCPFKDPEVAIVHSGA